MCIQGAIHRTKDVLHLDLQLLAFQALRERETASRMPTGIRQTRPSRLCMYNDFSQGSSPQ